MPPQSPERDPRSDSSASPSPASATAPARLRVEHLGAAELGLWESRPRLSWWLPEAAARQVAYEIELHDGRRVRVDSDHTVLNPWPFESVPSRERIEWRVRVWSDSGPSTWSTWAWFEVGLLHRDDWSAAWIEPDERDPSPAGARPVWYLHHEFELVAVSRARLYATAHGIYEVFLNDHRVGDFELTPGFTSYHDILQVQTYDVTALLRPGTNHCEVRLSDGWYRGLHGNSQLADGFGDRVAFLAQLEIDDDRITTGAQWWSNTGAIVSADLMAGQTEDRRVEAGQRSRVVVVDHGFDQLTGSPAPPVRAVEEIVPVAVVRLDDARQIIDLGQNINGRLRLDDLGPRGASLVLAHGEAVDADGDVTTEHLEVGGHPLGQIDRVTSSGGPAERFEPRHTVHGFRYVRVTGHPHTLSPQAAAGVVIHSDLRRTGWFRCSDDRLNRLHDIADWSFRANACDIPTDCPHRERSGWTGDWQVFLPSAAFLYDVAGFSVKWLRDLANEQLSNGLVLNYAPDPRRRRALAANDPTWFGLQGSSGWGDACVIVPWLLQHLYGDDAVLEAMWPTMRRWLAFAADAARTRRHPSRATRPAGTHEAFLWDSGWHWGEWLEPASEGEPWYSADQGHVATAYLHHSATLAARIGRHLGHDATASELDDLAAATLRAWRAEYLDESGSLQPDTQANHVRALAFGLVPEDRRVAAADRLVSLIRDHDTHLATGFLTTAMLLPVLAEFGHIDVAYELLMRDTPPSWLTMVDRGATTMWEHWEGVDDGGNVSGSLDHYAKGGVITFLHRWVGGIRPIDGEVAYRRFEIAPRPGGGITWADTTFDSPSGRIVSSWRIAGERFRLTATVPPGTTADIDLPDGTRIHARPGTTEYECRA